MKLIKIGRSSSCDVVLQSENVSSHHAEITVLDNGEIFICDKNSSNGTYVGGTRINPNAEVKVRRGDLIQFADVDLNWARIPKPDNLDNFKTVVNIGSNYRNDIHLTTEFGSRFHAVVKVDKKNNAFIRDLGSKNGVKVNGLRIAANKDVKIKRGDVIICADQDVTEEVSTYLPDNKVWKLTGIIAACAVALCIIGFLVYKLINVGDPFHSPSCEKLQSQSEMTPAVVLIQTRYYFVVEVENNPIPGWEGEVTLDDPELIQWISGTGFFIDENGNIATNRHVAQPWEYAEADLKQAIRTAYDIWLDNALAHLTSVNNDAQLATFAKSELGSKIYSAASTVSQLNAMLRQIRRTNYKITGRPLAYYIAYPGRNYTEYSEMDRCDFIAESGTINEDVAIIQRNVKKTPEGIKIFDINKIRTDKLVPQKDKLYTIGYPMGFMLGLDKQTHDLQPGVRNCSCSKPSSRYEFEVEGTAIGGQSGSPIFDDYGHLVGLVSKSRQANTILAVKAECLKKLYDSEANK